MARRIGPGLLVGAVLFGGPAQAQNPAPRDTVVRSGIDSLRAPRSQPTTSDSVRAAAAADSIARRAHVRDSLEKFRKGDTLRAPFTRSEAPPSLDIGDPYRWDREAILSSGATTLADLLEHIPGATGFRTGWIIDNETAGFLGDLGRVRVFVDGVPVEPLDVKGGLALDLSAFILWQFEEVMIERGAAELRVYLRSWRVNRTVPYTRVDIYTGDLDLNVFRGFFGQRFGPGFGIQAAGENLSMSGARLGGDGTRRAGMLRLGWAGAGFSIDAFAYSNTELRSTQQRTAPFGNIAAISPRANFGYIRAGYGDPERGTWLQLIAASTGFGLDGGTALDTTALPFANRTHFIASGGLTRGALRVSAGLRSTSIANENQLSPSVRASWDQRWLAVSAYAEQARDAGGSRGDVSVRLVPLSWIALSGSYGGMGATGAGGGRVRSYASRAEVGVRVAEALWLSGGMLQRDSAALRAPTRYDTAFVAAIDGPASATFVALRGRLWNAVYADVLGLQWQKAGPYRPRYQTRTEIYVKSRWLSRFPSGAFGITAAVMHEYREPVLFPTAATPAIQTVFARTLSTRLEIRILQGVVSWQWGNIMRELQDQVPGALMPRANSVYGIRWEFSN